MEQNQNQSGVFPMHVASAGSKLILVPTPLGNLEDITHRAVRILREADLVLAEDTRQTAKLLSHYNIGTPLQSFHLHNEHNKAPFYAEQILTGKTIALVSDAGTPGISDPGYLLVRACLNAGAVVECLPGPTALIPAVVASGLPCEKFCFEGFLPQKKGRQTRLKLLAEETRTIVLYESPHRLLKLLDELIEYFGGDRQIAIFRELTKLHEEAVRGSVAQAASYCASKPVKGELVIVIHGKEPVKRQSEPDEPTTP